MAGFAFVMMLLITVIVEACTAGLPAIASGDFAVVGFSDICTPLLAPLFPSLPSWHMMRLCSSLKRLGVFLLARYLCSILRLALMPHFKAEGLPDGRLLSVCVQFPLRPRSAPLPLRSTSSPSPCPCCGRCLRARQATESWPGPCAWSSAVRPHLLQCRVLLCTILRPCS